MGSEVYVAGRNYRKEGKEGRRAANPRYQVQSSPKRIKAGDRSGTVVLKQAKSVNVDCVLRGLATTNDKQAKKGSSRAARSGVEGE